MVMQEKTLLKLALITSLLGILALYLISDNIDLEESNIERITLDNKDEFVKVIGKVSRVVDTEKVTILDIMQPNEITVVLFKTDDRKTIIQEGDQVEIIGKVDEYEGSLEIIAHKARIIR